MNARNFALNALATLIVLAFAFATQAQTGPYVAYVSQSGTEPGYCSEFLPCRTINYALRTHSCLLCSRPMHPEAVIILDSGTYAPFTVNTPVTVSAAPG